MRVAQKLKKNRDKAIVLCVILTAPEEGMANETITEAFERLDLVDHFSRFVQT
jgi:hypothetical protein